MKLLGSNKSKINKDKTCENVSHLEITEVVSMTRYFTKKYYILKNFSLRFFMYWSMVYWSKFLTTWDRR